MTIGKVHRKHGFEYYNVRWWEQVTWYFRPEGAELWAHATGDLGGNIRKPELESLLAHKAKATEAYKKKVDCMADVEAAQKRLAHTEQMRIKYRSDDFDPGGSRSNPGAVARDMRLAGDSAHAVKRAKEELESAKKAREILIKGNRRSS
jgi:hypothetical protein